MEKKSRVLNDLFVSREEDICALTEFNKKRIKELTKEKLRTYIIKPNLLKQLK